MPSSKEYLDYIIEKTSELKTMTYKKMMGEYLLYVDGVLIGGIYDNRLLVKINDGNKAFKLEKALPYKGAKMMYMIKDTEDKEKLVDIIMATYKGFKNG